MSRKKLFEIIEPYNDQKTHGIYDCFMIFTIVISLIPLLFKVETLPLFIIDKVSVSIFCLDYILRWVTADYLLKKGRKSFLLYPFTFMAIIDLVSILPSLTLITNAFRSLKLIRLFRTLQTFRAFRAIRHSKSLGLLRRVFIREAKPLLVFMFVAVAYVLVSAIILFNVEPNTFEDFMDALYLSCVSLTTIGYGDITPATGIGRAVLMSLSIFGIAIIALPSGFITAGFTVEMTQKPDYTLTEIAELKEKGLLTDKEFQTAKDRILK